MPAGQILLLLLLVAVNGFFAMSELAIICARHAVDPEHKTLELMARFRCARPHPALVTDEYGTTLGLATPADGMESIAGQLPNDLVARPRVIRPDCDSWIVDAQIELHDLERALRAGAFPTNHPFMTLAGFILENLRNIPAGGEVVIVNGWRLEVMDVDDKRIDNVIVSRHRRLPPPKGTNVSASLYVSNLPPSVTEEALAGTFAQFGTVLSGSECGVCRTALKRGRLQFSM